MHPMVKPALRRGWRDLNTVQFGMTPAHALTLAPVDTATGGFLELLNGTRGPALLREEGHRMDLPEGHVDRVVDRLAGAGLLDDSRGGGPAAEALREKKDVLDRLRPDLATLSLTTSAPGDAIRHLAARRALRVGVRGAGRVGAALAGLLSGAGVGEVDVRDGGCVEPWDVAPGGLPARSVGDRRDAAARRVVRAAAPGGPPRRSPAAPPDGSDPGLSLVVVAPRDDVAVHTPDPASVESLMASGTPHLYAGVVEGTGVVGPLVLPGETGCAGCLYADRTDRDPAWPRLVAQWRSGRPRPVPPCDLTLAATVAGLAAAHALAFLDGGTPAGTGVRWEVSLPALRWHARLVAAHPACPCGAAAEGKQEHIAEDGARGATMAGQGPPSAARHGVGPTRQAGTWRAHV
ncbi:TOMM precursor leader peptide-binding protein [Streptomyces olivaceus]|uniref:TOMM leader peptide-binding protein n=1 Tax=Streptomyces olivaceus TaxID=47716 RepID=A0ABS7VYA9_STROV|nr:TOMM precursor leader peptide-binding protein [Streptomyces olivaceus]MBZ6087430.1 TOMM precursor leader peptide-binding protein [Streptomyces olivaceus]MBZ6093969.1 TOMM precursor leader peptide-binding protein [Streptomyces olivaceus]MBZ6115085.1 TOMM precursor leader peptide-binding protein [Streptomyces olivaceus]MBZ6150274.1 TOMM precursor leader peptide-binding protein [Streptomyces olivaceus]MBZ6192830.1 TOMM precursor leader peptide-binding protein [Streptomyces olivaceus]